MATSFPNPVKTVRSASSVTLRFALGLLIVLLLLFASSVIFRTPTIGVADNGDYWRVMLPAGIDHAAPRESHIFDYVRREYRYTEYKFESIVSSGTLLALSARKIYRTIFPNREFFDLRALGGLCLALFLVATLALVMADSLSLFSLGMIWLLLDPNYFLFFNSFFSESTLFLSLLGLVALLIFWEKSHEKSQGPIRSVLLGSLLIGMSLMAGLAKHSYILIPATLLVTMIFSHFKNHRARRKIDILVFTLLFLASILSPLVTHWRRDIEPLAGLYRMNNYDTVFFGIAKASQQPKRSLDALNIPENYHHLAGTHFLEVTNQERTHELMQKLTNLSRLKLLFLWITDPPALKVALEFVQRGLKVSRLRYPGHFEESAGLGRFEFLVPWQFSLFRDVLYEFFPLTPCLIFLVSFGWLSVIALKQKWQPIHSVALFFLLTAMTQIPISILGDGLVSMGRHLILARFSLDVLLLILMLKPFIPAAHEKV